MDNLQVVETTGRLLVGIRPVFLFLDFLQDFFGILGILPKFCCICQFFFFFDLL